MTIVVAEDQTMLREVVVKRCRECGHKVLLDTKYAKEAAVACLELRPDILILDLELEDCPGMDVLEELANNISCSPRVLVLSCHIEEYVVYRLERAGIWGFIDKSTELLSAISDALSAIAANRKYFSRAFQSCVHAGRSNPLALDKILSNLDMHFITLAANGLSDGEIAGRLRISVRTAEGRRSHILRKLQIKNTSQLILYARQKGFHLFSPTISRCLSCDASERT